MTKILLLPLDERPCNYDFPQLVCQEANDIELIIPPTEILGNKKEPGNVQAIEKWFLENIGKCEYGIVSIDMLVYGGIVPSRLHYLDTSTCKKRISVLVEAKQKYPAIKIFAYNLIMRAPSYNSSEEEPDYYAKYGEELFKIGVLKDKIIRDTITKEEKEEYIIKIKELPKEVIEEFLQRRRVNQKVNTMSMTLLKNGIIDFLVIPLDDCGEFGWAAIEQRQLRFQCLKEQLTNKIYTYSGADEVGLILLARAVNFSRGKVPGVFLKFSSINGPFIIPKYEDRPLGENLKWLISAAGGFSCPSVEDSDFILMVNSPTIGGERMAEASLDQSDLDSSYYSERCLPEFFNFMQKYSDKKPIALADLAMGNGADKALMEFINQNNFLNKLFSYAGWNTAANAGGTCIAHAMIKNNKKESKFVEMRILEDWIYMADIRQKALQLAIDNGGDYFNLNGQEQKLAEYVTVELKKNLSIINFDNKELFDFDISFPWHRLFEIKFNIK
ncbi:MAG: DUF4127 family protein [Sphaerochaetaceae bacterium]